MHPLRLGLLLGAGIGLVRAIFFKPSFASALVDAASVDVGVLEGSSRVTQMLANYGIHQPVNWCAVAVGSWIRDAANALGVPMPIPGSASAKSTMLQFQNANNPAVAWVPADLARQQPSYVQPGTVVIWQRGDAGSWLGHIGVVTSSASNGGFSTIEGNDAGTGDRVARGQRRLDAGSLLGFGVFTGKAPSGMLGATAIPPGADVFTPEDICHARIRH
jgi:hypothetical protein